MAWHRGRRPGLEALKLLESPDWFKQPKLARTTRSQLLPLTAFYLLHARAGSEPADAAARFHLGNGARLERLNWFADTSEQGMQESAGLMVNYSYRLEQVERNHEIYFEERRVVASHELSRLARNCPLPASLGFRKDALS